MKLAFPNICCVLLAVASLLASCTKMTDADKTETNTEALGGIGPVPVPPYTWTELDIPGNRINYPYNRPWATDIVAPVGNTFYLWTGTHREKVFRLNKTTMRWEGRPDADNVLIQHKVLFKYNSKVYYSFDNYFDTDFHSLDPVTGTKTDLAPFPAQDSIGYYPHTFVVGDNGYIFFEFNRGLWRYNFPTNTWTLLPHQNHFYGKRDVTIEVINGRVFGGMGYSIESINGSTYAHYHRDWNEFNPEAPGLTPKAQYNYYVSGETKTCVINDNIYVGFGNTHVGPGATVNWNYNLFKYNINSNRWSECTDYPGTYETYYPSQGTYLDTRVNMFSIGSTVYVVAGGIYEFWRYGNTPIITGTN